MTVALGVLWATGASALSLAGLRDRRFADRLVADFVTGAVIVGFVGTATIVLGLRLSLPGIYLILLVLIGCGLKWGRRADAGTARESDPLAMGILAVAGIVLAAVGAAAASDRLWWDGWAIWALKARVLFLEGTLPSAFLDPNGPYVFTHLDYPLLVPLIDWWGFQHLGAVSPQAASFIGFFWFLLIPLLLWGALRDRLGERIAALAALAAAACWPIAFYATGGTADVVIALALLGAIVELDRAFGQSDRSALWRAGIFLALGATAKNEGLALAVVGICIALAAPSGIARASRLPALLLPLAMAGPWLLFTQALGLESDVLVGAPGVAEAGGRGWMLAGALLRQFTGTPWQPLTALALIGVVAAFRKPERSIAIGWAILVAYSATLCGVYASAPHDLSWLIATTLPRVFGALAPAALFLSLASGLPPHEVDGLQGSWSRASR
jgi:hypothetical protein